MSFTDLEGASPTSYTMDPSISFTPSSGGGPLSGVTAGGAAQGIGGIFGAAGDFAEGSAYGQAAQYADINAGIAGEEGRIKLAQTQR